MPKPREDQKSTEDREPVRAVTPQEASVAYWVACYAEDVVGQIIEKGRPDYESFRELCSALGDLKKELLSDEEFAHRAEDIFQGMNGFRDWENVSRKAKSE